MRTAPDLENQFIWPDRRPTLEKCPTTPDRHSFLKSIESLQDAVNRITDMANSDACNSLPLPTFAKKSNGTIKLGASTELTSNHPTHSQLEVDRLSPLESALKIGDAETCRGLELLARKVALCFAVVVVVMVALGLPFVLLGIDETKYLEVLVFGAEKVNDGARNGVFASGETLSVKVERRDGAGT